MMNPSENITNLKGVEVVEIKTRSSCEDDEVIDNHKKKTAQEKKEFRRKMKQVQ